MAPPAPNSSTFISVRPVHQTLMRFASLADDGVALDLLPGEDEVLAALLIPFLRSRQSVANVEDEQRLAVEAFEIASKTWQASTTIIILERVLWACRAASLCTPGSYLRGHLLGLLYALLYPRGQPIIIAKPLMLQSLLQNLFQLRAAFGTQPDVEDSETHLLEDLIAQIQRGELGLLERRQLEDEYRESAVSGDDDDALFAAVARGAMLRCTELAESRRRRWLVEHAVEVRY
jgi:hypothetical protein